MAESPYKKPSDTHSKTNSPLRIAKGERGVNYYYVLENEMKSLGVLGGVSTLFWTLSCSLGAFYAGVKWDYAMIDNPSVSQSFTQSAISQVVLVACVGCFVAALALTATKSSTIKRIKKQHRFAPLH